MSALPGRNPPLRGYRRKKAGLDLDLNSPPVPEQEGTSTQATFQPLAAVATIDVEAIDDRDDDVMVCTASAFAEAKSKSQRNRGMAIMAIVDVEAEESMTHGHKRRRAPSATIDFGLTINLECNGNSMVSVEKPAPPPEEPTFSCPICMGAFVEETSTKCGHIFCKACIRTAIATQAKCPTCRKRVYVKDLIRVFLPATNLV